MSLARTLAVALTGVSGQVVEIESDLSAGLPGMSFTGLADTSVVESRDRIRAAVLNSGVRWPNRKITVALFPADVRKVGSRFDLAVALAVLASAQEVAVEAVADAVWIAELGLDGRLRPVRGVLPSVVTAQRAGVRRVVVAPANAAEAALVHGVDVRAAHDLREVLAWLRGDGPAPPIAMPDDDPDPGPGGADLADVAGQAAAKRALEVSAAGEHHLYLVGAPGAGKTMLAERLPGLLPALDDAAALEVTAVHSVAGQLAKRARLVRRAPIQAPHHTASVASLVGGGSHLARPGAISLAHHGVLFLDEAPEFSPRALDALRQPLESGSVVLHRGGGAVSYPARFLLVLAANPCPCGSAARTCVCAPQSRRRYQQRLSGPLLDRIDVRVHVDAVPHGDLFGDAVGRENSQSVAARVADARAAAAERWCRSPWRVNGAAPGAALRSAPWALPHAVLRPAEAYLQRGEISARGFDRVLRLAWTVADLAGHLRPDTGDVAEALFFRTGSSGAWAA
ncbi:MAG: Mg chelatase-like protein [Pseudonocardiales bacterium]|nr:MAG: Mg chelatase-like protein [Pseudonocardiales bacterium]